LKVEIATLPSHGSPLPTIWVRDFEKEFHMAFLFESLNIYKEALKWVETVDAVVETARSKVSYTFIDQLSRAALSIPLNIAEGNGRRTPNEKRQFFYVVRGSILESVPLIQVLRSKGILEEADYGKAYSQLELMSKMIAGLIKSQEGKTKA
jgi:four helix bundle protein